MKLFNDFFIHGNNPELKPKGPALDSLGTGVCLRFDSLFVVTALYHILKNKCEHLSTILSSSKRKENPRILFQKQILRVDNIRMAN